METPDKKIEEISKDLVLIQTKAKTLIVNSQESLENATKLVSAVKARWKRVEEVRVFFTKPLNDTIKTYNAQFRPILDKLEELEEQLKKGISGYAWAEEQKRRKEEAAMQAKIDKENAKAEKMAEKKGLDFVPKDVPVVASETAVVKTNLGKAVNVVHWTFELEDGNKVPRKYCVPDMAAIRAAVQNGERSIEGVRIFEEVQVRIGA